MNDWVRTTALGLAAVGLGLLSGAGVAIERRAEANLAPITVIAGDCQWSVTLAQSVVTQELDSVAAVYTDQTPSDWQEFLCPFVVARLRARSPVYWLRSERWLCEVTRAAVTRYYRQHFTWYPAYIVDDQPMEFGQGEAAIAETGRVVVRVGDTLVLADAAEKVERSTTADARGSEEESDQVEAPISMRAAPIGY